MHCVIINVNLTKNCPQGIINTKKTLRTIVCPCRNNTTLDTDINLKFTLYFASRFFLPASYYCTAQIKRLSVAYSEADRDLARIYC